MAETLVIRLGSRDDSAQVQWMLADTAGVRIGNVATGSLEQAAADADQRRVAVLVPAVEVLLTTVQVPVRGGKLRQVVPFATEEQLAGDIDTLHFALGKQTRDGAVPLAVVNRSTIQDWLDRLSEAGIAPDAMYSEAAGVAHTPGAYTCLVDGELCYVCEPDGQTTAFDGQSLTDLMDVYELNSVPDEQAETAPAHLTVYLSEEDHRSHTAALDAIREWATDVDVRLLPDGVLPILAVRAAAHPGINLLQGQFARKSSLAGVWRPWRYAAVLLGAVILLHIVLQSAQLISLKSREADLDEAIRQVFVSAMGPNARVVNPELQMRQAVAGLTGEGPTNDVFLQTLAAVGGALSATPNTRLERLGFSNRVMDLSLTAPNVDALESIRKSVVDGTDLQAEIQSTRNEEGGVAGRLEIKVSEEG